MSRRLNFTGRKRIRRENLRIRVIEGVGNGPQTFTAEIRLPDELISDPSARVWVEPYVGSSSMRFDFGSVARIEAPEQCVLSEIDAGAAVLFRVKVVDKSVDVGRILASAEGVRPENDRDGQSKDPLLPVRTLDLIEEIWRLRIDRDSGPELLLNNRIPGISDRLKSDFLLQAAVLPEVVRILVHRIFGTERDSLDEDAEWVGDWKNWICDQIGRDIDEEELADAEALDRLMEEVPGAFAKSRRFATNVAASLMA